jgi:DNA-binding transcriptional regulator YiaG
MPTLEDRIRERQRERSLPPAEECLARRERAGLERGDAAEILGVSYQSIWNWEHGARRPRGQRATDYAAFLSALETAR